MINTVHSRRQKLLYLKCNLPFDTDLNYRENKFNKLTVFHFKYGKINLITGWNESKDCDKKNYKEIFFPRLVKLFW